MDYLVCNKCNAYYELQPGEKPEDFNDNCSCGGKLEYTKNRGINDNIGDVMKSNEIWNLIKFKKVLIVALISIIAQSILIHISLLSFVIVPLSAGFILTHWLKLDWASSLINLTIMALIYALGYGILGMVEYSTITPIILGIYLVSGVGFYIVAFIGLVCNKLTYGKNVD